MKRINERNIGDTKHDSSAKKRSLKKPLTESERDVLLKVIIEVREAMRMDGDGLFYDGGRFTLCLTEDEMNDLFNCRIKL